MGIKMLTCPKCGGNLEIKEDKRLNFCPYCGTQIEYDDGSNQIVKAMKSVGNVVKTKIEADKESKILEMKLAEERDKRNTPGAIAFIIISCIIVAIILISLNH